MPSAVNLGGGVKHFVASKNAHSQFVRTVAVYLISGLTRTSPRYVLVYTLFAISLCRIYRTQASRLWIGTQTYLLQKHVDICHNTVWRELCVHNSRRDRVAAYLFHDPRAGPTVASRTWTVTRGTVQRNQLITLGHGTLTHFRHCVER